MAPKFSYPWYIDRFEDAKYKAEKFILSIDDIQFQQPPARDKWCIAECYDHLIQYGDLYRDDMAAALASASQTTGDWEQPFRPRWIFRKLYSFFEPPYNMKLKTIKPMEPEPVSDYNRMELLDEYINLQDQFIAQLEKGRHQHIDLQAVTISHPILPFITMTLSECFALAEAHQRRHQWQAEQTLEALTEQL